MSSQQDLINSRAEIIQGLLGQPPSALDSLVLPDTIKLPADGFKELKEPEVVARKLKAEKWYAASVTVGGFVYSSVTVRFNLGDYGDYIFDAGFWGAFGGGAGGGGGPWVIGALPKDGEKMEFELAMGTFTAGAVQMFWWRKGGPIQGAMDAVIGGLGVGGTKGTGKWKKA